VKQLMDTVNRAELRKVEYRKMNEDLKEEMRDLRTQLYQSRDSRSPSPERHPERSHTTTPYPSNAIQRNCLA
jgi:hypothetical protein